MHHKLALASLCAALASGCGLSPDDPGILVRTTPPGASCTLTRQGQPIATVAPTPAIALVEGAGDIAILCSRQGFADAAVTLPAQETGRSPFNYPPQVDIVLRPGGI